MDAEETAWFCLRAQPKHEHIAAAHLRREPGVEVFLPRIRYRRATRQGPAQVTEALFPGYLFARFQTGLLPLVRSAGGVSTVVHFGSEWAVVPAPVIDELKTLTRGEDICVVREDPVPGERVRIARGPFAGMEALVTRVMSAGERVKVLFEIMGRASEVEVSPGELVRQAGHPLAA
jgi:transcriptional antiterminator RfaH